MKGLSEMMPTPSDSFVVLWPPCRLPPGDAPDRALANASLALLMVDATASGLAEAAATAASARAARILPRASALPLADTGCDFPVAAVHVTVVGLDGRLDVNCFLLLLLLSVLAEEGLCSEQQVKEYHH